MAYDRITDHNYANTIKLEIQLISPWERRANNIQLWTNLFPQGWEVKDTLMQWEEDQSHLKCTPAQTGDYMCFMQGSGTNHF